MARGIAKALVGSMMTGMSTKTSGGQINIGFIQDIRRFFGAFRPWIVFLLVIPIFSAIFHAAFGHFDGRFIFAYFFVGGAFLTRLAYKYTRSSAQESRVNNAVTMAAVVALLMAATFRGFIDQAVLTAWFGGGVVACTGWTIRYRARTANDVSSATASWSNTTANAGDPEPSTWRTLSEAQGRVSGIVSYRPGVDALEHLKARTGALASAAGTTQGGVKVSSSPDLKPHQAIVNLVLEEQIAGNIDFEHDEMAGTSIADGPLVVGKYEDGEDFEIHLYSPEEKSANHLIISGMNGTGKSVAARTILVRLFNRYDVNVIASDTVKGVQTLGKAAPGLDIFLTDKIRSEMLLAKMKKVITDRADWLGKNGFDGWEKGCGLNFLVLLIEEAPELIRDSQDFITLTATARSAGISIIASIQRATYSNMPTDARSQFPAALCFGTKKSADAAFVLGQDLIDRGADPSKWGRRHPGWAYAIAPHISEDREVTKLKTINLDPQILLEVATERGIRELDAVTAKSLGDFYTDYKKDRDKDEYETALEEEEKPADEAYTDDGNPNIEEPDVSVSLGDPADETKTTSAQAQANFNKFLAGIYDTDERIFRPKDGADVWISSNRTRSWFMGQVNKAKEAGIIGQGSDDFGIYRVVREP